MNFRFKLKGKCRIEKWEVYLYGDKTIKVDSWFKLKGMCRSEKWEVFGVSVRCLELGCSTDSVHRLMVDIPVAARHGGFQQGVPAMKGGRSSSHR